MMLPLNYGSQALPKNHPRYLDQLQEEYRMLTQKPLDQMTQYLEQTKAMSPEPELQFQPAPTTGYEIVDFALARIKKAEVEKFGFVGNEQYYNFDKADNEP